MHKLLSFLLLLSTFAYSAIDTKILEETPTLNGGRVKPLYVQARESIKFITGKTSYKELSAIEAYYKLSTKELYVDSNFKLPILIEHIDAKNFLNLSTDKMFFDVDKLLPQHDFIRAKVMQIKESTSLKKELTSLWARLNRYKAISAGEDFKIYKEGNWVALNTFFTAETTDKDIEKILLKSSSEYVQDNGNTYLVELTLFKSHIFSIAMLISLIAIFATVLLKSVKAATVLSALTIIVQIIGISLRVIVSGRAPITNMYETVMFSGFGALVISLIILAFKKDKLFLLAGLGYNVLCLFMMKFANNMLDESISPLVPVLRDNFWLSTHVTTIILSYAALALSWLLANIVLIKASRGTIEKNEQKYYENLINTCVIVGVTLLSAGIILGGVWADYSWGRFWGWDPKETWSLIVFLFYITLLHGRYTNWLNPKRFILSVAGGFMTVMMAWFGVNYILASGLHSYGFSEGGAIFLGSFFAVQTIFLVFSALRYMPDKNTEKRTANA